MLKATSTSTSVAVAMLRRWLVCGLQTIVDVALYLSDAAKLPTSGANVNQACQGTLIQNGMAQLPLLPRNIRISIKVTVLNNSARNGVVKGTVSRILLNVNWLRWWCICDVQVQCAPPALVLAGLAKPVGQLAPACHETQGKAKHD
jgi:hypothetical protein